MQNLSVSKLRMLYHTGQRMDRRNISLIVAGLTFTLIFVPIWAGFLAGTTEAGWVGPWPNSVIASYGAAARMAERIPVIGRLVRFGNFTGYAFADGPETTR